jgi:hypothetical protein
VTGTFGLVAASRIMQRIVEGPERGSPKPEGRSPKEGRIPKSEEAMRPPGNAAFPGTGVTGQEPSG